MIRIDEIYENTFWPWLRQYRPGVRISVCDPFGRSDPDSVITYGDSTRQEHNYIFFFDQEPIHLNLHLPTFQRVMADNADVQGGAICTSEKDSDNVRQICEKLGWQSYYYFFHGWAALDWYRGYDKTFLITPVDQRIISKTFISPNRIIAGERSHRIEMLYHLFRRGLHHNHVSCPLYCPAENISIYDAAQKLLPRYPDIVDVLRAQTLPISFANETNHPMHSCWLSLFQEACQSLLYLVTETIATGRRQHLTEKTFKPIAMGMPFVTVASRYSLRYLRSYGFQTFGDIWDESYDDADDTVRIEKIANLLEYLDRLSQSQQQKLFQAALPIITHNWNHFYHGGFEEILWQELKDMLNAITF